MPHGCKPITKPSTQSLGKDELNLADWPISVPTHQQPRKKDGGKVDFIEHEIPRSDGSVQRVTLEAPSRVGLPTPTDEDFLLGLLFLAKEQGFASDKVRFVPQQLLKLTRHASPTVRDYDRLEEALYRLRALTLKYELAWYDKLTAEVQPVLITGILAEAKLVRRRGRRVKDSVPDSYVQWTGDFYQSIKSGNLTDLDLDLYFSLKRPGAKHLYRHLNKRFHGKRRNQTYERDLAHLACGHLGMTNSKDLKRYFHNLIVELESTGYLPKRETKDRYRKVRPGVYRVVFDPPAASVKPKASVVAADERGVGAEHKLVCEFHRLYSGRDKCRPTKPEREHAGALLSDHGEEFIFKVLPKVIAAMQSAGFAEKAKYFGAAVRFFDTAIEGFEKENRQRERESVRRQKESSEHAQRQEQVARDRKQLQDLRKKFLAEPLAQRQRLLQQTIDETTTDFQSNFIRRQGCDDNVSSDVLHFFARSVVSAE